MFGQHEKCTISGKYSDILNLDLQLFCSNVFKYFVTTPIMKKKHVSPNECTSDPVLGFKTFIIVSPQDDSNVFC